MPQVDAPFVDAELDTSDPTGSAMSIVMAVLGVGLLYMVVQYGQVAGGRLTRFIDGFTGANASGSELPTRGDL